MGAAAAAHVLELLFSLSICNLKTLIVHITFSCKWDPFCETIEIVNTSQYSAQRLPRRIFCPTRLDGGCCVGKIKSCCLVALGVLESYCVNIAGSLVLISSWPANDSYDWCKVCRTVKLYNSLQGILSTKNEIKWFRMTEIIFTFGLLSFWRSASDHHNLQADLQGGCSNGGNEKSSIISLSSAFGSRLSPNKEWLGSRREDTAHCMSLLPVAWKN